MDARYRAYALHQRLAETLEAVERGELTRVIIMTPPRHGKSRLVSVAFPAWYLGRHPDRRVIGTSYAAHLAATFSGQARNQFDDPRWPFPGVELARDTHSKTAWNIAEHGGGYIAAGLGGPITGFGADLALIDDPVRNWKDADSQVYRDAAWDWYQSTLYTRLEQHGAIVLVLTRWHEDDLAGRLLAEQGQGGEQWHVLRLPAIAEDDDPLGRAKGEALWPEKYSAKRLDGYRTTVGSRVWNALYQQRPTSEEGALFKRQWFHVMDEAPDGLRWVRYWDLAVETKTTNDYTASAACALAKDGSLFIRDMVRGRWEWPDQKTIIKSTMLAEPRTTHVIEKALHGAAALQELQRDRELAHIALKGVSVDKDKVTRANAWSARAEAGKVVLVRGEWVNAFIDEAATFPQGAHDDQVDSVSGAVAYLGTNRDVELALPASMTGASTWRSV